MNVVAYKLGARYRSGLDRVEAIADQAARLVEKKLRESVGNVRIVASDTRGYRDSILAAEQQILGTRTRSQYPESEGLAHTTLMPSGVLILVDLQATPSSEIDKTVIHELVHAAQFGRPGVRDAVLAGIRNNHGIEKCGWFKAQFENRKVAAHEREAVRLESLARKIR